MLTTTVGIAVLAVLFACGGETVIQTVVVEKEVPGETIIQTVVVEKEVVVEVDKVVEVEKEGNYIHKSPNRLIMLTVYGKL